MELYNKLFSPMLLSEISKPFNSNDYIYELKFDGIRALVYANSKSIHIYNRHEVEITNLFPELQNIKSLVKENVIFDGEIICIENGNPSFSKLQERSHLKSIDKIKNQVEINPVIFMCFDIIYQGKDLCQLSLIERKKILSKYKDNDYFIKTKYINYDGIKYFKEIKKKNLEGIVAKERNSTYDINTRSSNWIKIKNFKEEEFYIGGYTFNNTHVFSVLLGEYTNNEFIYIGRVFIAKKNKLFNIIKASIKTKSIFINYNEKNIHYIKPSIKVKVRYMERTKSNRLRQPFYVGDTNE